MCNLNLVRTLSLSLPAGKPETSQNSSSFLRRRPRQNSSFFFFLSLAFADTQRALLKTETGAGSLSRVSISARGCRCTENGISVAYASAASERTINLSRTISFFLSSFSQARTSARTRRRASPLSGSVLIGEDNQPAALEWLLNARAVSRLRMFAHQAKKKEPFLCDPELA